MHMMKQVRRDNSLTKYQRQRKNSESYNRRYGYSQTLSSLERSRARRRRLASTAQRKAANLREQRRMMNMKDAFKTLYECLPVLSYKKKMSRIEILRLAIVYIKFLQQLVDGDEENKP
ncbi:helix loop helix domain [Mactra antiquata]